MLGRRDKKRWYFLLKQEGKTVKFRFGLYMLVRHKTSEFSAKIGLSMLYSFSKTANNMQLYKAA